MAWREATPEELSQIQGASSGGGWRDASPEELALIQGGSPQGVKPGDVEGAKAMLGVVGDAATGFRDTTPVDNKVREDVTVLGELGAGLSRGIGGAFDILANPGKHIPSRLPTSLKDAAGMFLESPVGRAVTGAAQAGGAGFAPISNVAARAGEGVADLTGSEAAGALTMSAIDSLPALAAEGGRLVKPLVKAGLGENALTRFVDKVSPGTSKRIPEALKSNRTKAQEAEQLAEANIAAANQRSSDEIVRAQQQGAAARGAARAKAASDTEALAAARANAEAANESIESITEAAKKNLPNEQDLRAITGDALGEATGAKFQGHYNTTRKATKDQANALYDEALGKKGGDAVDVIEQREDLRQAVINATTPEARQDALSQLNKLADTDVAGDLTQLHDLLVDTRFARRAAQRLQNDNLARKLGDKVATIQAEMEKVSPGVLEKLSAADAFYAEKYAPYFSKGSITRAIADKDPAAIAKNVILPRSQSGKEVATVTRAMELIGDNATLKKDVAHSHLGGLIDEAAKSDDFRGAFIKQWERFTNPSGNNNRVLRTAYGKEYDDVNSIVNQMKRVKPKDFDELAEDIVKKNNAAVKKLPQEAQIESTLKSSLEGARRTERDAIKISNKARELDLKLTKNRLKADLEKFLGRPLKVTDRIQSIGAGIVASGTIRANVATVTAGSVLVLSGKALSKLVSTARGRSLWKGIVRAAPGTVQAAALARITSNFLKGLEDDE